MELATINRDIKTEITQSNVILPNGYRMDNALKSAFLIIQEKNFLKSCTPSSIYNSLLDMTVQGLDPIRKQCYFINYGNKLTCRRSYMGSIAVAKRMDNRIADIDAHVIFKDDIFEVEIVNGKKRVSKHIPADFSDMNGDNITGVYAVATDKHDKVIYFDLMTRAEVFQSWRQSAMNPIDKNGVVKPDSVHGKFPVEMTKKTVYNRLCKHIINSACEDHDFASRFERTDEDLPVQDMVQIYADAEANKQPLDFKQPAPIEAPAMATRQQAERITELEDSIGQHEHIVKNAADFVGRDIKRLGEMTHKEAENYIGVLAMQSAEINKTPPPESEVPNGTPNWKVD